MKTISIPTNNNPFTVIINNREYTYKGGETIEVPDEVAEAIDDALELVPKPKRYQSLFAQRTEGNLAKLTAADFEGVTAIANYAFYDLKSIRDVTFNRNVTSIGNNVFFGCSNLESVRFEENSRIESIGIGVFEWCQKMTRVHLPEKPPKLTNTTTFSNINPACVFYCKSQAILEAYKEAPVWSTLTGTYTFVVEE